MRLTLAIQKSKEDKTKAAEGKVPPSSGLSDLVDLNFGGSGGPHPPQRTAASHDPWSPLGEGAGGGAADPWGGQPTSTIPDPWGGIGAVGVPPSRASPIAFPPSSPGRTSSG